MGLCLRAPFAVLLREFSSKIHAHNNFGPTLSQVCEPPAGLPWVQTEALIYEKTEA